MAAAHDDDPGFWPGYVAAVSGLVQGLLIMAMALGIAIFAVGQLAEMPGPGGSANQPDFVAMAALKLAEGPAADQRQAGANARPVSPLSGSVAKVAEPASGPQDPAQRDLAAAAGAGAGVGGMPPAQPTANLQSAQRSLTVNFADDAVTLPPSAVPALLANIAQARAAGYRRWQVTIAADTANPRRQRAAYLRLMGLRTVFMRQGVAAGDVDLWIEPASGRGASGFATIEPLPQPGQPGAASPSSSANQSGVTGAGRAGQ